jgi:hypothetical protein
MPSYDQQTELRTKCTWTWTTRNGKNGYEVVGPNGNSLFLPATEVSSIFNVGSYGNYWSRTLDTDDPDHARYLKFYSSDVYTEYGIRYKGLSVRPVRVSQ